MSITIWFYEKISWPKRECIPFAKKAFAKTAKGLTLAPMKARDLERLLTDNGVAASKMSAITRVLRNSGRLEIKGRGPNAPDLDPQAAAIILIATAGAGKATGAAKRLLKLEDLREPEQNRCFLAVLTEVLEGGPSARNLVEVRIGRNIRSAVLLYPDRALQFLEKQKKDYRSRLSVEGVLPYALLHLITELIRTNASVPYPRGSEEPDDDA